MEEASLQQINMKTPEFMETAVNGWFSILEAQFHLRNITASTTKFYTVISSLPAEVVAKIPITILELKKIQGNKTVINWGPRKDKAGIAGQINVNNNYYRPSFNIPARNAIDSKTDRYRRRNSNTQISSGPTSDNFPRHCFTKGVKSNSTWKASGWAYASA